MKILISIILPMFIPELAQGESNPYRQALLAHPLASKQNYVIVRPGVHIFYWLNYADGTTAGADCKPLIIWLQGGPGLAASGIGNFAEIGPLTLDMTPRDHTWVKGRNVLMFDYPAGTGFSFVLHESLSVQTDQEIVSDLANAISQFFNDHETFRITPTYIIGQGYGGKICPMLTHYLHKQILKKDLKMNIKGIGIGNGFVDPKESLLEYPKFLYNRGLIEKSAYSYLDAVIIMLTAHIDNKEFSQLEDWDSVLSQTMRDDVAMYMDLENINKPSGHYLNIMKKLQTIMNNYVKPMLLQTVDPVFEWKPKSEHVYKNLNMTTYKPSTEQLQAILNSTNHKVAIYNGNLDAVSPVAGASNWVDKLKWNGSWEFERATQHKIRGKNNGFYKAAKQLSFWTVFGAGRWVPEDNPVAMEHILEYLISDNVHA